MQFLRRNAKSLAICRFGHLFEKLEHVLASATNPRYKLGRWLDWLPGIDATHIRTKAKRHLQLIAPEFDNGCSSEESEETEMESVEDQLFQNLYEKSSKKRFKEYYVNAFFEEAPIKNLEEKNFPNVVLKDLFLRYNTPIPSSAAVERLFSVGKDILRPKRCRMTDKHFEMLVFLRANKA